MPFGLVFGAVVFVFVWSWIGLATLLGTSEPILRLGGVFAIGLGVSLALGLLRRQRLARWAGLIAAVFLSLWGLRLVIDLGLLLGHVVFLSSTTALVLLAIPATGDVRRGLAPEAKPRGQALGWIALACLTGFAVVLGWMWTTQQGSAAPSPAFARERVEWLDFEEGLERARTADKVVLVDFFAEWCGPCKAMDRGTFRDRDVVQRLKESVVPVRVDSEEVTREDGVAGAELAEQYKVLSYPTLMILDGDGAVISRKMGYQSARQLLSWLDRHLAQASASDDSELDVAL